MDRKGIIAVVIAIAVLIGWTQYYSNQTSKYAEEMKKKQEAEAKLHPTPTPAPAPGSAPAGSSTTAATTPSPNAPLEAVTPEKLEKVTTPAVVYTFTNLGGGIQKVSLPEHKANEEAIELNRFGVIPIGALSESAGEGARLPFQQTSAAGANDVVFERNDARKLKITKTFHLPGGDPKLDPYITEMTVSFKNDGDQPATLPPYYVYTGSAAPLHQADLPTYTGFGWMHGGKFTFKAASSFSSGGFLGFGKSETPIVSETAGDSEWAGVASQYFTTLVTPSTKGSGIWAHKFTVPKESIPASGPAAQKLPPPTATPSGQVLNAVEGAIQLPGFTLAPGTTTSYVFKIYTGPREYGRLKKLGGGQEAIMDFGTFKIVSITLLNSMNRLKGWLGSYALAIIVLTIIIRGLMWPLQNKATQSMKNIAALQPKMNELKERYPDDPTRQQQEVMKLYKQYNINPLMGCLPMFIQIPIFFGFYNMLGKAVELRNAHFMGWVKDLSQPDTIGYLFGMEINILPLLMAVTMFWQMKISPKSGDAVQQRVFMFMPIIFIMFCYKYASALALYWTVQNLFSIVQLYLTRNKLTPVLQKVPATATKRR